LRYFTAYAGETIYVNVGGGGASNASAGNGVGMDGAGKCTCVGMEDAGSCADGAGGSGGGSIAANGFTNVPFGSALLFSPSGKPNVKIAFEMGGEARAPLPPSAFHAAAGATILANPAAHAETAGAAESWRKLIAVHSERLACAYVRAGAGYGESVTDYAWPGHCVICENGAVLDESPPFKHCRAAADVDLDAIAHDRRLSGIIKENNDYKIIVYESKGNPNPGRKLLRRIDRFPFMPGGETERARRCDETLDIQSECLMRRLEHTASKKAIIAVSGGLDSSLALIVATRAFDKMNRAYADIDAITMPCFGTSDRTRRNALELCAALGVGCRTIDITNTVKSHFADIGQSECEYGVTFENAQARVRTLVLMDVANSSGGLAIGPGDLSELALGYVTYGGDHMSMYAVNAGVPKTLVRRIVGHLAETCGNPRLRAVLKDILATPVSAELLPPADGVISQQTEELIGPYELHDFFIYHALRYGRSAARIYALASSAFEGDYSNTVILKWLRVFYRRFISQQFKRSCMPDGPAVGPVSLSPRGGLKMPSDAACGVQERELDELTKLFGKNG